MNRRRFLRDSATLALGARSVAMGQTSEHPMAPPVVSARQGGSRAPFAWTAAGVEFSFGFDGDKLRVRHVLPVGVAAPAGLAEPSEISGLEVSILCSGEDVPDHHGAKLCGGSPGIRLRYVGMEEGAAGSGRRMTLTQVDDALGLRVESEYTTFGATPVVRRVTHVTNTGTEPVGLEYVSSAMLHNFAAPATFQDDLKLHFAYNSWQVEAQWRTATPAEMGLVQNGNFSVTGAMFSALGSWPCERFLPMGMVENVRCGTTWFWQVEHNGSWHCEVAQTSGKALYAYFGGPDAQHGQAWKELKAGERYTTVPVAVGCVRGGFEEAVRELTAYRRASRLHPRSDSQRCPVVFNDVVMLDGDQTADKEVPLIDAAAAAGCEIFCMDAGWTSRPGEGWWDAVGDWVPNRARFPGGLRRMTDYIRQKGMVAGLWIEPEVASPRSELAKAPDEWFFLRHGRRVIDHSRFHLDFRNPAVRDHMDRTFDRLIDETGFEYLKLDYNINALEGTERQADSFGQGLLGHNRAFLAWMDALLERHRELTIETVASGSMRMEHSMLSRAQLQSISDQDDYRLYASLTTGCSAAIVPEQMGVWAQPMRDASPDAASCNMVNAMLGRIHLSGFLPVLSGESAEQVRRGVAVYKTEIRQHIPTFVPFYPLGMSEVTRGSEPAALGMRGAGRTIAAVWRRDGPEEIRLPWHEGPVRLLYPTDLGVHLDQASGLVSIRLPRPQMGCLIATLGGSWTY